MCFQLIPHHVAVGFAFQFEILFYFFHGSKIAVFIIEIYKCRMSLCTASELNIVPIFFIAAPQ